MVLGGGIYNNFMCLVRFQVTGNYILLDYFEI